MATTPKILAFAGSAREASFNKKIVQIAANGAKNAGAQVTYIDLRDFPMPLYDEDLEAKEGLPENVLKIKALMKEHHGFLIASPEYNSSVTPLIKNVIDWASRPEPGEAPLALSCYKDKVTALLSISPGGLGGLRGLIHLRSILGNIGVLVLPDQKTIPNAYQVFDEQGNLKEQQLQAQVEQIGARLATVLTKLV